MPWNGPAPTATATTSTAASWGTPGTDDLSTFGSTMTDFLAGLPYVNAHIAPMSSSPGSVPFVAKTPASTAPAPSPFDLKRLPRHADRGQHVEYPQHAVELLALIAVTLCMFWSACRRHDQGPKCGGTGTRPICEEGRHWQLLALGPPSTACQDGAIARQHGSGGATQDADGAAYGCAVSVVLWHPPVGVVAIDAQLTYPPYSQSVFPAPLRKVLQDYLTTSKDPFLLAAAAQSSAHIWFRVLLASETVFQIPCFIVAIWGLLNGE
ncbi:hypothetical protein L1887_61983 [Cichorium endivia]|nr:hypothetical protein L1887_61983 [Cichorium endivia]